MKYLEYLSFYIYNNPLSFFESIEYQSIIKYHNEIFDYENDSQNIHDLSHIKPTQKNIRELVDNVIIQKYLTRHEKR